VSACPGRRVWGGLTLRRTAADPRSARPVGADRGGARPQHSAAPGLPCRRPRRPASAPGLAAPCHNGATGRRSSSAGTRCPRAAGTHTRDTRAADGGQPPRPASARSAATCGHRPAAGGSPVGELRVPCVCDRGQLRAPALCHPPPLVRECRWPATTARSIHAARRQLPSERPRGGPLARTLAACARRNTGQVSPARRGAGGMPWRRSVIRIAVAGTSWPGLRSSPSRRTYPHRRFSRARRTISACSSAASGGRPGRPTAPGPPPAASDAAGPGAPGRRAACRAAGSGSTRRAGADPRAARPHRWSAAAGYGTRGEGQQLDLGSTESLPPHQEKT
jgi:hypothetical protein